MERNRNTTAKLATYTVRQVVDAMLSENPTKIERTVDQLRSGSMDQEVTGVVTTMFPTLDLINETIKIGANMIIAHETPYFNNNDDTEWLKDDDVFKYKIELLNKHKIAIHRFHDHWHRHKPDGIIYGCLLKMGWEKYYNPEIGNMITLPTPILLEDIIKQAKKAMNIPSVRVVGDLKQPIKTVMFCLGFTGIGNISKTKPDLVMHGEAREIEHIEEIRDGKTIGEKVNLLTLGHSVSEEPGMVYCATWLAPKLPGLKITSIPSGNPFQFV